MPSVSVLAKDEAQTNLRSHRFFHGCKNENDCQDIGRRGFRADFTDEDGHWQRDGNLGKGIYLSCDWRTAVWFGPILLEATLLKGTRILDASLPADRAVLDQLKREFGSEILKTGNIRKIIPRNKKIDLAQLVELNRYFYNLVWNRDWKNEKVWEFSAKDQRNRRALDFTVSYLKRYGFHGYGDPQDDNGIVIFAPDRIRLIRVIKKIDWLSYSRMFEKSGPSRVLENMTLDKLADQQ